MTRHPDLLTSCKNPVAPRAGFVVLPSRLSVRQSIGARFGGDLISLGLCSNAFPAIGFLAGKKRVVGSLIDAASNVVAVGR